MENFILMKMLKIIFVLVSLVCLGSGFKIRENICRSQTEITSAITKIKNSLLVLKQDPENIITDVILGLSLTKTNLLWSVNKLKKINKPEFHNLITNLEELINLGDSIVKEYETKIQPVEVVREKLWLGTLKDIRFGELKGTAYIGEIPDGKNCTEVQNYLLTGGPYYSDYCISQLFKENCEVENDCYYSETNLAFHSGYKTTHRLFYLQIAMRLQCDKKNPEKFSKSEKLMKELCVKMYLEAEAIAKLNYPVKLRDVFIEQIALCGLEGYAEFAKPTWRELIRNWETEPGCFDSGNYYDCEHEQWFMMPPDFNKSQQVAHRRRKRTDSMLKNGCHTHIIAVTISAMSFHLRYSVNECISMLNA